jgi:hypothetical protein
MRRCVAVLLTLCLTASTVEALVGAGQHAEIHAAPPPAAAAQRAPLAGTPIAGAPAATHDPGGAYDVVLPRHTHHDTGDPAPPSAGHCAHFHTVAPVGVMASCVPSPGLTSRYVVSTMIRPTLPSLSPPTQPPRA